MTEEKKAAPKTTAPEARLKTIESAIKEVAKQVAKLDDDLTAHVVTGDAHNLYILSKEKK